MNNTFPFAENFTIKPSEDVKVIKWCRKLLLFHQNLTPEKMDVELSVDGKLWWCKDLQTSRVIYSIKVFNNDYKNKIRSLERQLTSSTAQYQQNTNGS